MTVLELITVSSLLLIFICLIAPAWEDLVVVEERITLFVKSF